MPRRPFNQGHFDGLCGIYSLLNSVSYLHGSFGAEDCDKLFAFLIKEGGDLFPDALYNGLNFEPLYQIATKMAAHLAQEAPVEISRPFFRRPIEGLDHYLDELASLIGDDSVAIVGLGKPWDHWTVIKKITPKSVAFHDSYGIKRFPRSEFVLNKVGFKRERSPTDVARNAEVTELCAHQTIIVRKMTKPL